MMHRNSCMSLEDKRRLLWHTLSQFISEHLNCFHSTSELTTLVYSFLHEQLQLPLVTPGGLSVSLPGWRSTGGVRRFLLRVGPHLPLHEASSAGWGSDIQLSLIRARKAAVATRQDGRRRRALQVWVLAGMWAAVDFGPAWRLTDPLRNANLRKLQHSGTNTEARQLRR